nr:MAG TPA: hypothetical protein [Caudoviricetes sp.]
MTAVSELGVNLIQKKNFSLVSARLKHSIIKKTIG